ncbi:MAG TPA: hypothetical protein DD729_08305 [Rhodobacteraceae bacterium]|nr:hypothetical protein [Paracoccaceae bacterium]
MSETDSFIEEVSEEVRRDKLFALMRKYGWVGILAVFLLVGGAAFNEWRKASERSAAQDLGDHLLFALEQPEAADRSQALSEIKGETSETRALIALLASAEAQSSGDLTAAAAALNGLISDTAAPKSFRDLATLKLVLLQAAEMPIEARRESLTSLASPGAPFRLLAEEQLAMLDVEEGNKDAAISRLKDIIGDVEVTAGLRNRASQLIVVLGGKIEAS